MSELRWHPLLRQWVAVAAHRQGRPQMPKDWCPFCPGSGAVGETYDVRLYPNDFPAFSFDADEFLEAGVPLESSPFFRRTGARGSCDVVLYSPNHRLLPSQLPVEQWEKIIGLWTHRFRELRAIPDVRYVFIFENTGEAIGVTMPHPHGQIYAFPFVPPLIERELESARDYHAAHGDCLYCRILAEERKAGSRIVAENGGFVAFIPYFARFPQEMQIYSRRHSGTLEELTPGEQRELAEMLSLVRRKYDNFFGSPMSLMMLLRQSPVPGEHPYSHFHIELDPIQRSETKLKYLAGVESGAGTFLNDTLAEERAAQLRQTEPVTPPAQSGE
jgi:UDPglucose--hexose-1-phosphate uridylyltransferase